MPLPDQDSAVGHSFGLELDDLHVGLLEVEGLVLSIFGLERGIVDVATTTPSRPTRRAVTVVRPLSRESTFADWAHRVEAQGVEAARRSATVVVFAADGSPVARYHLENAWPSKLEVGSLTRGGDMVVVEKLTLTYEDVAVG
jgi:phage tail-like protein